MRTFLGGVFLAAVLMATPALANDAATVAGVITDATGAALPGAKVVLRDVATGREASVISGADGKYTITAPAAGTYLVLVTRQGFSEAARTVVIAQTEQKVDVPVQLELGSWSTEVSVTAARAEREIRQIPLHVETLSGAAIEQTNPLYNLFQFGINEG